MRLNEATFVAISGFCSLVLGLLCSSFIFPKLENYLISKATALEEGSKTFETWKKIPFPFKFKIYFFNVTNVDDVQMGSKPIFKEMGPYIYDEFREKEVLGVSEENDTIKYLERKSYYFNQDESGCRSEDDTVTILHFAIVSMASKVNKISPMALPMLDDALPFLFPNIKDVFITSSVRNILFDGLKILCDSEEVDMICDGLRSKPPHTIRSDDNGRDFLFSLFHHINGTDDGPYEIGRGGDTSKGKVMGYKDTTSLTQWKSTACNEIQGTDLTINPSLSEVPQNIDFFVSDFCRYFSVKFYQEMNYLGLETYYFRSYNLFQSRKQCFCEAQLNDEDGEEEDVGNLPKCPPEGMMDVSPCTGSPIVVSQPHFLGAERFLLAFSQGLKPNKDKHQTFIIMEPKTGLVVSVRTRFQMNMFLKKYQDVSVLRNVSEGFFPFIWIEIGADIPMDIIEEVKSNFSKLKIFDVLKYLLMVGGVILLGVSIILAMVKDKLICFCGRKNTIGDERFMGVYPDLKMKNGNNVGRYVWKISD